MRQLFAENLNKGEISDFLLSWILGCLNVVSFIIASSTVYQLYKDFHRFGLHKVKDLSRRRIRMFFYLMATIPFLVSIVGHVGATNPSASIWIFPASNLILAFCFLLYLQMMIVSAGGKEKIKDNLSHTTDICGFPRLENRECCRKLCLKENAWLGMRFRFIWCFLVFIKPLFAYVQAGLSQWRSKPFENSWKSKLMSLIVLTCTFGPVQGLRCFQASLGRFSRIDRMAQKTILIQFLVPLLQIQMSVVDFLVVQEMIKDLNDTNAKNRGARIIGVLFCIEMVFIGIATSYIYHGTDLLRWQEYEKGWLGTRDIFSMKKQNNNIKTNEISYSESSKYDSGSRSLEPAYKQVLYGNNEEDHTIKERLDTKSYNTFVVEVKKSNKNNKNNKKNSDDASTVLLTQMDSKN